MTPRRLFTFLLFTALFALGVRETLDPDMWWHLRTGQLVWEQGIPRQDPFSFTMTGTPWVAHEWLSDAIMWGIFRFTGIPGLILFFAAVTTTAFAFVLARCPGRPYLAGFVTLLAALTSILFLGVRPQMFNVLILAIFVYVAEGVRTGKLRDRALVWLPPLTLLWANLHSGYFLGIVLLVTYVIGETVQRVLMKDEEALPWSSIESFAAAAIASLLFALFNPHGYWLWFYPFMTLGSPAMQSFIGEWQSPNFHIPQLWLFPAMIALGSVAWAMSLWQHGRRLRPSITGLLLFMGGSAAGLLSARHIPLFTILAAPLIANRLMDALKGTRLDPRFANEHPAPLPGRRAFALNSLLALLAVVAVLGWAAKRISNNETVLREFYPVEAVEYLQTSGLISGRIFNEYRWGGFLIWQGVPVFVDGRADVYGDDFLMSYLQVKRPGPEWQEPLDDYNVNTVLIRRDSPLAVLLAASRGWHEAYADEVAQVFVRGHAEAHSNIDEWHD